MAWVPPSAFEGNASTRFSRVEMSAFTSGKFADEEDQLEELMNDDNGYGAEARGGIIDHSHISRPITKSGPSECNIR